MSTEDDGDLAPGRYIVCQGYPKCPHRDKNAVQEALDGCVWCIDLFINDDGSRHLTEPGNA
jgi:ssDNA-binding Zn-finger/Zn-ribbon topoisomerase 1